jgi:hypothetical protein
MRQARHISSGWLAMLVVVALVLVAIPITANPVSARCVGEGNRGNIIGNTYSHEDDRSGSNNTCDGDTWYSGRYMDPPPNNGWCATVQISDSSLPWYYGGKRTFPQACTTGAWVNYSFNDNNTNLDFRVCGMQSGSVGHCSQWLDNWGY